MSSFKATSKTHVAMSTIGHANKPAISSISISDTIGRGIGPCPGSTSNVRSRTRSEQTGRIIIIETEPSQIDRTISVEHIIGNINSPSILNRYFKPTLSIIEAASCETQRNGIRCTWARVISSRDLSHGT